MTTNARVIENYVHNGRIGVLIELGLENPFTVKAEDFVHLARDLALHVAASNPDTPGSLLEQPFIKDTAITVRQMLADASTRLVENIVVLRFVRWDTEAPKVTSPEPPKQPAVVVHLRSGP